MLGHIERRRCYYFNRVISLSKNVMFEQKYEEREGVSHSDIWEKRKYERQQRAGVAEVMCKVGLQR